MQKQVKELKLNLKIQTRAAFSLPISEKEGLTSVNTKTGDTHLNPIEIKIRLKDIKQQLCSF